MMESKRLNEKDLSTKKTAYKNTEKHQEAK